MMVETMLDCSQEFGAGGGALPQWKRELLARRAMRRPAPAVPPPAPPPPPPPLPADDEELRYGPGIVNRLRSRYLSLALRVSPPRPTVLRRATSLEHLLDESPPPPTATAAPPVNRTPRAAPALRRELVKRARSVDALSRVEPAPCPAPRAARAPRRPAPLLRDTERPPPDVVRSTLRKFEGGARRAPARPPPADGSARYTGTRRGAQLPPLAAANPVLLRRVGVIRPMPPPPLPTTPPPPSPAPADKPEPLVAVALGTELIIPLLSPDVTQPCGKPELPVKPDALLVKVESHVQREPLTVLVRAVEQEPCVTLAADTQPAQPDGGDPIAERSVSPAPDTNSEIPISPIVKTKSEMPVSPITKTKIERPISPIAKTKIESPISPIAKTKIERPISPIAKTKIERPISPIAKTKIERPISPIAKTKIERPISPIAKTKIERPISPIAKTKIERPISPIAKTKNEMPVSPICQTKIEHPLVSSVGPALTNGGVVGERAVRRRGGVPAPAGGAVSVVFNFCARADVPDYIENDGLVLRAARRPHPAAKTGAGVEDGAVSSDEDDSDGAVHCSPVRFVNDNVLMNNRSSLLQPHRKHRVRHDKLKLQFDDSLTRTFEYPSETSLCEQDDDTSVAPAPATPGDTEHPPPAPAQTAAHLASLAANTHIVSAALSRYTPCKTAADSFQLGVTRAPPPLPHTPAPATPLQPGDIDSHRTEHTNGAVTNGCDTTDAESEGDATIRHDVCETERAWSQARLPDTDLLF